MTAELGAVVWKRIEQHAGEAFRLKGDAAMTYRVFDGYLVTSRTAYQISKRDFERALAEVPLSGPGQIRDRVRGPSYVFAILMDPRIRRDDW